MKKSITIISFVLIFCLFCSSCKTINDFPTYSEKFDKIFCESFYDNYYLADGGLAYYKASPEVKIPTNHIDPAHPDRYMIIGEIQDTDKSQFVSVIADAEYVFTLMGSGNEGYLYVYQRKSAPNPMEDWHIESVMIVCGYLGNGVPGDSVGFIETSENYMELKLSQCREIKTLKNETDSSFINGIQNAYLNSCRGRQQSSVYNNPKGGPITNYYLIVKFKENSNIVWYTPLFISNDGFFSICHSFDNYDEYLSYEGLNRYSNANKAATFSYEGLETHYGNLSEEITNELYEILVADGWDPTKNKPVSAINTTASDFENSESEKVPIKDSFTQTD